MHENDEAVGSEELNRPQQMGADVDYGDSAYDDLFKEAAKDDAIGEHDWLVTSVVKDHWPSGDDRYKIVGQLIDVAGNTKPKADLTWSPPPTPDVVRAEMGSWDQAKKRAITQAVTIQRKCREYYSKNIEQIAEGDTFRVQTARAASKEPGRLGFLRVVALHSKDKIGAAGQAQQSVPF